MAFSSKPHLRLTNVSLSKCTSCKELHHTSSPTLISLQQAKKLSHDQRCLRSRAHQARAGQSKGQERLTPVINHLNQSPANSPVYGNYPGICSRVLVMTCNYRPILHKVSHPMLQSPWHDQGEWCRPLLHYSVLVLELSQET